MIHPRSRSHRRWPALAGVIAVAVLAAACTTSSHKGDQSTATATSSVSVSSSSTTAPTTPAPTTTPKQNPAAIARAQAVTAARRYFAVSDQLYRNPKLPVSTLSTVETRPALINQSIAVNLARTNRYRTTGSTIVKTISATTPALWDGKSATVHACTDVRKLITRDEHGRILATVKARPGFVTYAMVAKRSAGIWKIYSLQDKAASSCG